MEGLGFSKMILMLTIMVTLMGKMAKSELHYVGGTKVSWGSPNVNFTTWSIHEQFYVSDWLYFGYDRHRFSVFEVNKSGYETCNQTGFIKNITGGAGRDVFQLLEAKPYYFISGGGSCWQNVKVAVNAVHHIAPAPQPASPNAASDYSHINQTFMVLILVFIWGMLLN
ncbi:hypothetical protein TanjilG_00723 [Lupinus angustifolius]|uniref:Phytocyanin domain-containing protein n=1 Tax=Lupinus angustifolius TaxID=3871 RepID=A0A4P1R7P6_LUPAN|nr:PREDICTED: lamin-like protein [Lupinus angustifolius]OIW04163.1 hypothetical protein TanjilG_00723 [Lupinus angustifolius]